MPEAAWLKSTPSTDWPDLTAFTATAMVIDDASTDPPNATNLHARVLRARTMVETIAARRSASAAGTLIAIHPGMLTSTSPPDEQHDAHHQDDHIGEVGVDAAGLQDLHSIGHSEHRPQQRAVHIALEGWLDLDPVAHLAWKIGRAFGQRLDFPCRPIH